MTPLWTLQSDGVLQGVIGGVAAQGLLTQSLWPFIPARSLPPPDLLCNVSHEFDYCSLPKPTLYALDRNQSCDYLQ